MARSLWSRLQEDLEEAQALEPVTGLGLRPYSRAPPNRRRAAAAATAAVVAGAALGYLGLVSHGGQQQPEGVVPFRSEDSVVLTEDRVNLELEAETQGGRLLDRLGDGRLDRLYPKVFVSFGSGTACRTDESDKSADGKGSCQHPSGVKDLDECKRRCDSIHCTGLEWSQGRCELWTERIKYVAQPGGSSSEPADSECFARVFEGSYDDFGANTVCRLNEEDSSSTGYGSALVKRGVSREACFTLCRSVLGVQCAGVEIQPHSGCEMWTMPIGYHKRAGGYRCASFQLSNFELGRPFLLRSKMTLECLADDLTTGDCLYSQGLTSQSWQLYRGHIVSTNGHGETCLDIAESGKAQMAKCADSASHFERTSEDSLRITTGPKKGHCLDLGGGKAHAAECKDQKYSFVSFGEGTACRLNSEDETEDGEGTVREEQALSLQDCRAKCENDAMNCKGFQFTESSSARRLQALSGGPISWLHLPDMCLDVDEEASNVRIWSCTQGAPSQQFVLPDGGEGLIRWADRPDHCWFTDSDFGDSLKIMKCNEEDDGQKWVLHGPEHLIKSKTTGKCVDVYKEREKEGTNIITWPCKDTDSRHNQEFKFDVPLGPTTTGPTAVPTTAPHDSEHDNRPTQAPHVDPQDDSKTGGPGKCFIWQQPVLHAKAGVTGAQCFSRVVSSRFRSLGKDTACRADSSDNTANANGRVRIHKNVGTRDECQHLCTLAKDIGECHGFEYSSGGHCELWATPIHHSKSVSGFECLVKVTSDQRIGTYPEPARVLVRRVDFASDDPKAVCRDGTKPAYYFRPATNPAMKRTWLMLLRGGGWCYTQENCRHFWASSSNKFKGTLDKMGIFSTGDVEQEFSEGSPLAGSNYIFMPYCSSDAHMGDSEVDGMQFRGYRIVRAALRSLKSLGMESGDTFVFAGWSAGARGAMMHLDSVHKDLPSGVKVLGYLDSPLYLEFEGFGNFAEETRKATELYVANELTKPCEEKWGKAERWKCAFGQYRIPMIKSKFLLIASQGDKYQVKTIARDASLREKFMKKTREVLWGLGENAAIHSSACYDHAVTENWAFNEEMVAATPDQLGLNSCQLSDNVRGCRVSMSLSLNLTLTAARTGGKFPKVVETCSGFHCGRWCLPLKECKPGGEFSDLCPNRG